MAEHFMMKSSVALDACKMVDGSAAVEHHALLRERLLSRGDPELANLFAEPFVSRDKSGKVLNIAWHSTVPGTDRALAELDALQRRAVEDRLHRLVPQIEALAEDPADAELIRAALSLSGPQDIRVINGLPVLVNWGVRPVAEDPLVPFMRKDPGALAAAPNAGMAAGAPGAAGAASALPPASGPGNAPVLPGGASPRGLHPVAWVPLVALLALAAVTLLWLLWPGVRIFPQAAAGQGAGLAAAQDAEIAALRDRRDMLRAALDGAQCRADGVLVLPGNLTPEGLPVLPEGTPAPAAGQAAPDALMAPGPERVEVPLDPANPAQTGSLLSSIEARTVLVIAGSDEGVATGSGFVVGPGLIVTNHHVVEGALDGEIYVSNATLGRAVPAELLKRAGPFEETGADFALLRIAETGLPAFVLGDPAVSMKLHHVVTAGFPGDVMETDVAFQALLAGDGEAMPDLVVVDGTVNAEQRLTNAAKVLVHSAPLSQGSSGGPLVDFCGRVVGVNTFVRQGPLRTLNFALSTEGLVTFLAGTPAEVVADRAECAPSVAYPGGTAPAAAAATPVPETAPASAPGQ